jgi:hypothetical protein
MKIKEIIRRIPFAIEIYIGLRRLGRFPIFMADFFRFKREIQNKERGMNIRISDWYPCLDDRTDKTTFDHHYVFHTAWAARVLAQTKLEKHIDISSSLYFCSIASAFIPIDFYDFRPAPLNLTNLTCGAADLTALSFANNSIKSLSCMHVIEHIGLGRYGDPLDPNGDIKAVNELKRVVSIGGNLLVVVPVGSPRIMFNAHRIYSFAQVRDLFDGFSLKQFALITDEPSNGLILNADPSFADIQKYGCGCFWFVKNSL